MISSSLSLILSLTLAGQALAGSYKVVKSTEGNAFFSDFNFMAEADPTQGTVQYVSQSEAQSLGLAQVVSGNFQLRADHTTVVPSGQGRKSVRMESKATYDNNHVVIFNVNHVPTGCGTWPALWEYGANWPANGEVDIFETVNGAGPNQMTLHTTSGCSIPSSGVNQLGHVTNGETNCDSTSSGPGTGCSVTSSYGNSFGNSFNSNGGGWYAMERTPTFVKVWFFPRGANNIPVDVYQTHDAVNTSNWPTPDAYFPNTQCNIDQHFGPNWITINLTFCGSWAGQQSVYSAAGCPGTCADYVRNNPSAFTNAYFEIPWVKVYQ
jgi:hypothetical protein